jgi:hypothetical protein
VGQAAAVPAEQDHSCGLARTEAPADVLWPHRPVKARNRDLPDLLAKREAVDGGASGLDRTLLRRLGGGRGLVSVGVSAGSDSNAGNEGYEGSRAQDREPPPAGGA